jgi:hypothetical protein
MVAGEAAVVAAAEGGADGAADGAAAADAPSGQTPQTHQSTHEGIGEDEYENTDWEEVPAATSQHAAYATRDGSSTLLIDFMKKGGGTPNANDMQRVVEHVDDRTGVTTQHAAIVEPSTHTNLLTPEALMANGRSDVNCDMWELLDSDGSLSTVIHFFFLK